MALPDDLWRRARGLSDEPEQQWTFPAFVHRYLTLSSGPLDFMYEDLSSWSDLRGVVLMADALADIGIPEELHVFVSLGFEVYEEGIHSKTGRLAPASPGEPFRGRHSVAVIGWDRFRDEVVFRNSWGGTWGDGGIGYISEAYFNAHVDSVVVSRAADIGPSRAMDEEMRAQAWKAGEGGRSTPERFFRAWTFPNRIRAKSIKMNGRNLDLLLRELLDLSGCKALRAIELREGDDLLARAHLQESESSSARLVEFWVPPVVRRHGFGRLLEAEIVHLCRAIGYSSLTLVLNEADASKAGVARARGFATALGYDLQFRQGRRPNTVAEATKPCL